MYGDVHRTPRKALGLIPFSHFGVEMPGGEICENSMPGTRLVPFADFARGRPTQVHNPGATAAERAQTVQRAASCLGERRYHLAAYNCEHFATWCATGVAVSHQVAAVVKTLGELLWAAAAALLATLVIRAVCTE
jgi:Lecithin retinol acyltransferase